MYEERQGTLDKPVCSIVILCVVKHLCNLSLKDAHTLLQQLHTLDGPVRQFKPLDVLGVSLLHLIEVVLHGCLVVGLKLAHQELLVSHLGQLFFHLLYQVGMLFACSPIEMLHLG